MSEENHAVVERRKPNPMFDLMQQIHLQTQEMHIQTQAMHVDLKNHIADEHDDIASAISALIEKSFPEGDPDTHRIEHELAIAERKAKLADKQWILREVQKWAILGLLAWAGMSIWVSFLHGPQK